MMRVSPASRLVAGPLGVLVVALGAGCLSDPAPIAPPPVLRTEPVLYTAGDFEINTVQSVAGHGAGQAIFIRENFVYILGDRYEGGTQGPGVIREYFWNTNAKGERELYYGGREILLTENGSDLAPHPTGLTWHPNFGYWLGNTVDGKGTLYQIDFERALRQGDLDGCVLRTVEDDAAINGSRPEFIELPGDRWTLATSDYGDAGNALRFYDPVALLTATRTSEPGVLVAESACGPFVQTLEPGNEPGEIYLVQNITAGKGYRLTRVRVDASGRIRESEVTDFSAPSDELEAFAWLETDRRGRTRFMMLSAASSSNIHFGRVDPNRPPARR
ncbi:MAG: hypothetical protein ACTS22_06470 [Phycisphaerales bacterium]